MDRALDNWHIDPNLTILVDTDHHLLNALTGFPPITGLDAYNPNAPQLWQYPSGPIVIFPNLLDVEPQKHNAPPSSAPMKRQSYPRLRRLLGGLKKLPDLPLDVIIEVGRPLSPDCSPQSDDIDRCDCSSSDIWLSSSKGSSKCFKNEQDVSLLHASALISVYLENC